MSQHGLNLQVQHDKSIYDRWNRDVCWRAAISSQLHKTFYQKKLPGSCYLHKRHHIRNQVPHQSPEWWVVHFELLSLPRWLARHGECEVFILLELLYNEEKSMDFVKISQTFLTRMSSISARISWASAWTVPAILVYLFSTWCIRLNKT